MMGNEKMALQGNLNDFKLEEVMQTIAAGNKSGKLGVSGKMGEYGIYFNNGAVIHAFGPFSIGEEAIKDVFIESSGSFFFKQNLILPPKTIKKEITSIILDGIIIREELMQILLLIDKETKIFPVNQVFTGGLSINDLEWKVLRMVVEGATADEIITKTEMSFITFVRTLKGLLEKNLVKLGG